MKIKDMVETIRVKVAERIKLLAETNGEEIDEAATCFWTTIIGWQFINERIKAGNFPKGSRVLIQAGTMSWPFVTHEQDDGVSPTHFTYLFEPDAIGNVINLLTGALPEMHCWLALYQPRKGWSLIDLCSRYHKTQFKRLMPGSEWKAPDPPDYVWGGNESLPDATLYQPDELAIRTVLTFAMESKLMTKVQVLSYLKGE